MIMIDRSKRLSEPLRWTRVGRLAVIVVGVMAVAAVVTVVVIAATGGSRLRPGCIEVTFPSTLGGVTEHECGSTARTTCARPSDHPGLAAEGTLREACRRAGLPYGR